MAKNKMIQYNKKNDDVLGGMLFCSKSDLPGPQWLEGGGEGCCQSKCKNTVKEADYIVNTTTNKTLKIKWGTKNLKHFRNQATYEIDVHKIMCTKEGVFNPFQILVMQEGKIRHSGDKKKKKTWNARKLLAAGVTKPLLLRASYCKNRPEEFTAGR